MDVTERDELFPCARVFCNAELLAALMTSAHRRFKDSKTIVDLVLRKDPDEVLALFAEFPNHPSQHECDEFMHAVFEGADVRNDSAAHQATPPDYSTELPEFLQRLECPNKSLLGFVSDLKQRWVELCRTATLSHDSERPNSRSSLIPLPFPFFVPGGRFRECYYWDTLWVVKGLVASDMLQSAKGAVRNLLCLVERIGFVPNGNRVYYLNRSQPPILTLAVKVIYDAIEDWPGKIAWLREVLPALDKEYEWFSKHRSVSWRERNGQVKELSMSWYNVKTNSPRPESFREDTELFAQMADQSSVDLGAARLYRDLASAAESGWDFSSRWFPSGENAGLKDIDICNMIPCCLNGILLKVERTLSKFHSVLCSEERSLEAKEKADNKPRDLSYTSDCHQALKLRYESLAQRRQSCIQELLWNESNGFWFDYNVEKQAHSHVVSVAGLYPLWAGCWEEAWDTKRACEIVEFVMSTSGLLNAGGLSCTAQKSLEQWDFPNSWPPLVDIAVESLRGLQERFPHSGAGQAAEVIAMRFLRNAFRGWLRDRVMHEKYNSLLDTGARGEGGEYEPQTGFGWTNGTVLWLLQLYGKAFNTSLNAGEQ